MLNLNKLTITKKIGFLSCCAAIGMSFIILASLAFFGKIGDISKLSDISNAYSIRYHKAVNAFQHYTATQKPRDFDLFTENATEMARKTRGVVVLASLYQQYEDVEKVLSVFKDEYGGRVEEGADGLKLIKALNGKPILAKMVANCQKSDELILNWRQIAGQYGAAEGEARKEIAERMSEIGKKLESQLDEFHMILQEIMQLLQSTVTTVFIIVASIMMLVLFVATYWVARSIIKPLKETVVFAKSLSQGDLKKKVAIKNKDELGEMGASLNQMGDDLGKMLNEIKVGIETLSAASKELSGISDQMTCDTDDTSRQADDVAGAANNMSDSMNAVASAMEQTSENAQMVASSAEEMSATINEISKNAEKARRISEDANNKTGEAAIRMNELGGAAEAIGKVVETITDISEQVNLLALNATIEAARAGDAGKGFAVVANEIKELARQTADATQDIKLKIEKIQESTTVTITQTQEISDVIGQVNEVIAGIATAVEEQSTATREIAANITKTSDGIHAVSEHVVKTSSTAANINAAISEVNQSTAQIATNSGQVKNSSDQLSLLAETLGQMVSRFKM